MWLKPEADCLQSLDDVATRKIAGIYHPEAGRDRNKEWQVRLSGGDLTAHDAQRDLIIEVYRRIKGNIEAATTLARLKEIEGSRDAAGLGRDIEH